MLRFLKKKKTFWINFESIGVDIHSHLIPGVDDGAKTLEDSIEMIRKLKNLGFKKVIITPHVHQEYYPNTSERIFSGFNGLQLGLKENKVNIDIECAAEYYMDETFESLLERKELLTFGNNYVLIEMSFFQEAIKLDEYLFKMQINGYQPILAHPERYIYYIKNFNRFEDLKIRGCKYQMNLLSLTGYYGKEVKDLALKLLDSNLYDFVGTDTHNLEQIKVLSTFKHKEDKCSIDLSNSFSNHTFLV